MVTIGGSNQRRGGMLGRQLCGTAWRWYNRDENDPDRRDHMNSFLGIEHVSADIFKGKVDRRNEVTPV